MSEVSSEDLPSSGSEWMQVPPPAMPALPRLDALLAPPSLPSTADFEQAFPRDRNVNISDAHVRQQLQWCRELTTELEQTLEGLNATLEAEWKAKEVLLNEVLKSELEDPPLLHV